MTKDQLIQYIDGRVKSFPRWQLSASDLRDVLKKIIHFIPQGATSEQVLLKAPGNTQAQAQDGDWKLSVTPGHALQKHRHSLGQWVLVEEDQP